MSIIRSIKGLGGRFNVNVEIFNSTIECVEKSKIRTITDSNFDNIEHRSMRLDWEGVSSYKEALELMHDGYDKEVSEMKKIISKCENLKYEKRTTSKNDVCGFAPIVPLALLRVPNAMINTYFKPVKSRIISIYYDMSVNCGYSADDIISHGKKIVEAVIKLEHMGYRVELNSVQTYNDEKSGDFLIVNVKKANQPLDLRRISFSIIHPAMFRVIGFDWYSKFPKGKYRYGLGSSILSNLKGIEEVNKLMSEIVGTDAIFLSGEYISKHDVDYIVKQLEGGK